VSPPESENPAREARLPLQSSPYLTSFSHCLVFKEPDAAF
jgi:hypothetical protein